ncbi:hypothetical protein [Aeromonas salmonicida]|uniref:hypothetical protein n=1 Tax=Aeromonas salmonicida TaxID=645 RepID=UPI00259EC343|nr:hypothetical protein [Aeromonas salmonicida]MDM5112638.1 hypothetical protein [Aeromonas salmonicida]
MKAKIKKSFLVFFTSKGNIAIRKLSFFELRHQSSITAHNQKQSGGSGFVILAAGLRVGEEIIVSPKHIAAGIPTQE